MHLSSNGHSSDDVRRRIDNCRERLRLSRTAQKITRHTISAEQTLVENVARISSSGEQMDDIAAHDGSISPVAE